MFQICCAVLPTTFAIHKFECWSALWSVAETSDIQGDDDADQPDADTADADCDHMFVQFKHQVNILICVYLKYSFKKTYLLPVQYYVRYHEYFFTANISFWEEKQGWLIYGLPLYLRHYNWVLTRFTSCARETLLPWCIQGYSTETPFIQGASFTRPPPKIPKYKKVNLGKIKCI